MADKVDIPGFTRGVIGPTSEARSDTELYALALRTARNVFVLPDGPVTTRPGLKMVAALAGPAKLRQLVYDRGQRYLLVFGDQSLRIFRDGAEIAFSLVATTDTTATQIGHVAGTAIGDMTANGGLPAAFDGTDVQSWQLSAGKATAVTSAWIGKSWGAAQIVERVVIIPTSNVGFQGGSNQIGLVFNLRAKAGAAPTAADDGVVLASYATTDDFAAVTLISGDQATAYYHHWIEVLTPAGGVAATLHVAEVKFWSVPASADAPWSYDQAREMRTPQFADTMLLYHDQLQTRQLVRQSEAQWSLSAQAFVTNDAGRYLQPHHKYFHTDVTLQPSAQTGTVTLAGSLACFHVSQVGERFRIKDKEVEITDVAGAGGTEDAANPGWWDRATATVIETLVDTTETDDWTEPAFSDLRGWPSWAFFHKNRMFIGGGPRKIGAEASSARDVFDFDTGDLDSDAVSFDLLAATLDPISDGVSFGDSILLLSADKTWRLEAENITPKTPGAVPTASEGADPIPPQVVDDGVFYVGSSESGVAVVEAFYDALSRGYSTENVALLAWHIINGPVSFAYRKGDGDRRMNHLFVVNGDGTMAVLNTLRRQKITAWTAFETDGQIIDALAIGKDLYCVVLRDGVHYLEVLDAAHRYDNSEMRTADPATATFDGLDRFEGRAVDVRIGDDVLGSFTVEGGQITLDAPETGPLEIGLEAGWEIETLPPPLAQLQRVREGIADLIITDVIVDVYDTADIVIDGVSRIDMKADTDALDASPPRHSGWVTARVGCSGSPPTLTISGALAQPATVRAITYWLEAS